MKTGVSKKTLVEKLGIRPGMKASIINAPNHYHQLLGELPANVSVFSDLLAGVDIIHFFTQSQGELVQVFPSLKKALEIKGMLWISWPKGASKMPTDLKENAVREIGLANGLVDVKVCAIDENWSGLKFIYRIKDRK